MIDKFQSRLLPSAASLKNWKREGNWVERADQMDAEVTEVVKKRFITEKAKMMARHAETGRTLQDYGLEYLETHPISSQSAALRAIEMGIRIEGEAAQIEKLVSSVAKMEDPQIEKGLRSLLEKAKLKREDDRGEESEEG